jgi:TetR/AcrR family transcriptional regulator, cholesterol catabolism regulator
VPRARSYRIDRPVERGNSASLQPSDHVTSFAMSTAQTAHSTARSEVQRQRILKEAASLFEVSGYHNTSMEEIASRMGLRKPTLYHYFNSKEDILFGIHDAFIDRLIDRQKAREAIAMDGRQQLLEIIMDMLQVIDEQRGEVRAFFEFFRELSPDRRQLIAAKRDEYEGFVEAVIRQGVESGEFRDVDPRLAALTLFGMVNWSYQWFQPGGRLGPRELSYVMWDTFLKGIGGVAAAAR